MLDSSSIKMHAALMENAPHLLDAIPAGIIITSRDGAIQYLNTEAAQLFGYLPNELNQISIDTLLPDRFKANHTELRNSYAEMPSARYMGTGGELFGKRKDGSEFPVEVGLRSLETPEQTFYIASVIDITQRKKAETLFSSVIQASPYGKILIDSHGCIRLINQSLLNTFGYTQAELIGKNLEVLLPERYREIHQQHRENYLQDPKLRAMGAGRDLTGLHKNGTEIPIEIGINPVETSEGKFVLAAITDITERRRLELNLKQANAHLEEFTYVASHDLKSPLRGISDLMEWISEDCEKSAPETVIKNIDRVKIRISRMERLIDDLLRYARAGKSSGESKTIDVAEMFEKILELQPVPNNFVVNISIDIKQIQAASTPLETVLRNLISNAIKHHDGINPVIRIGASAAGNYCLFFVEDNGPGIPEAAQGRIFRLFQTLSATERSDSGFGLALAKRLTESHGGNISVSSTDGRRGSSFNVLWPRFPRKDIDD